MADPILFFGEIDNNSAEAFIRELNWIPESEPVNIWVNSRGGSLTAGWPMIGSILNRNDVTITVMGDASSFMFFMLLFADRVVAYDTANLNIHRAGIADESNLQKDLIEDIKDRNKLIRRKLEKRIDADKFEKVTGKTFDDIFSMDGRLDVRLTAAQAKKIGLVDEVVKLDTKRKKEIESRYYQDIAALSYEVKPKSNKMANLKEMIFGSKDDLLTAKIDDVQVVYSKLEKGSVVKALGEGSELVSGTFEAKDKQITVVENEITAVSEIDTKAKEITALKTEISALKENQISVKDVKEVVDELTSQFTSKIEALEATIANAKLTKSTPKIPKGEFKEDVEAIVDDRTIAEKIDEAQRKKYNEKQSEREAQ